jgi:hypothetical protein
MSNFQSENTGLLTTHLLKGAERNRTCRFRKIDESPLEALRIKSTTQLGKIDEAKIIKSRISKFS